MLKKEYILCYHCRISFVYVLRSCSTNLTKPDSLRHPMVRVATSFMKIEGKKKEWTMDPNACILLNRTKYAIHIL